MRNAWLAVLTAFLAFSEPVLAQDRVDLGVGRVFTNDAIGDFTDRWRTGSYTVSLFRGPAWTGDLPARPGQLLEWRLRGEILAPATLDAPEPGDRRYATTLGLGLHTHFATGGAEMRLGLDLVATGPMTGIASFQSAIHDVLSLPKPDTANQIGNGLYPTLSAEIGRGFALSGTAALHPFAEVQAGIETFARVGADITFGGFGQGVVMLRDPVTGHRVTGVRDPDAARGFTVVLGADSTRVWDSALLPDGGDAVRQPVRHRVRAGGRWQGRDTEVFYGAAWLSEEFRQQDEGQVVGALNLHLRF